MSYHVNEKGYYGDFGGAYIPEMLYPNVEELRENYLEITAQADFKSEFDQLLRDYVGRPTPLYYASRLSEKYNTKIYLKREKTFVIPERIKSTILSVKSWSQNDWEKIALLRKLVQDNMVLPPRRSVRLWEFNALCIWGNWTSSAKHQM